MSEGGFGKLNLDGARKFPSYPSHGSLIFPSSLLDDVLDECLSGLVGAADKWAAGTVQESHVQGSLSPSFEVVRRNILMYFHVSLGWLHVLPEGDNININSAEL